MLKDNFKITELTAAMNELYQNIELSQQKSFLSKKYLRKNHNSEQCGKLYYNAIETAYKENKYTRLNSLKKRFSKNELTEVLMNTSLNTIKQRQLLVDVSAIIKNDLQTGIQNVVKQQLKNLIKESKKNLIVMPVYFNTAANCYYYAYDYLIKLFDLKLPDILYNEPVIVYEKDIFYGLDFCTNEVRLAKQSGIYEMYKNIGVQFVFMIYDMLPITHKEYFLPHIHDNHKQWLETINKYAHKYITISSSVSKVAQAYTNKKVIPIHLGVNKPIFKQNINTQCDVSVLVVGTIEPRKAHMQILEAFELLWAKNINIHVTFVGKYGWNIETLKVKLQSHTKLNKNITILEFVDDLTLQLLYSKNDVLLMASYEEGFGLPIIEAASYKMPLILRDIPVFKEIAQNNAYYFPNTNSSKKLASYIEKWLDLYKKSKHPISDNLPILSWKKNVKKTLKALV